MTDRDLLEKAAKAAGLGVQATNDGRLTIPFLGEATIYWDPLTDDGDALRLAVKLELCVNVIGAGMADAVVELGATFFEYDCGTYDTAASTRRAIVRAAASMADAKATT